VRVRQLVSVQEEVQREYGRIVAVTVDSPYVNGAFRAGIGAQFPFLSDEDREVGAELDLLELTDAKHQPFLPLTFVLDSTLRIHATWCGFWYWGNPSPDELWRALREITRAEQPTFTPQEVWNAGGARPDAGIDAPVIWIREDADGREFQRGAFAGELPEPGDEVGRSRVDGRPWIVHEIERERGRVAVHLRKGGQADSSPLVRHHLVAPR
jgi:hypothetical protein